MKIYDKVCFSLSLSLPQPPLIAFKLYTHDLLCILFYCVSSSTAVSLKCTARIDPRVNQFYMAQDIVNLILLERKIFHQNRSIFDSSFSLCFSFVRKLQPIFCTLLFSCFNQFPSFAVVALLRAHTYTKAKVKCFRFEFVLI